LLCFLTSLAITAHSQTIKIVDNSRLAKIAGRWHGSEEKYAVTFGSTIFVSCTKEDFFAEDWWVRHEMEHVKQYKKYGVPGFLKRYMLYSIFHRYVKNPFEKEALSAEEPKH